MPLSFLGENSKRRSATLVKLLTYLHTIVHTYTLITEMTTSSREITLFYHIVEVGTRQPKQEGKLEERGHERGLTRKRGEAGGGEKVEVDCLGVLEWLRVTMSCGTMHK